MHLLVIPLPTLLLVISLPILLLLAIQVSDIKTGPGQFHRGSGSDGSETASFSLLNVQIIHRFLLIKNKADISYLPR